MATFSSSANPTTELPRSRQRARGSCAVADPSHPRQGAARPPAPSTSRAPNPVTRCVVVLAGEGAGFWRARRTWGRGESVGARDLLAPSLGEDATYSAALVVCRTLGNGTEPSFREATRASSAAGRGGQNEKMSVLCAKEMPASNNQAAEASKGTSARKIGPPGKKIRVRLPPRKRLAEGVQTPRTVVPEDTKNHQVSEHTDNNMPSMTVMDTKVKDEEACSKATGEGECQEANSNCLTKTMPKDTLPEEANFIVSSLKLTTSTEVQAKEEISYPVRKELCEEGDKNIMSEELLLEDTSSTPRKEPYQGAIKVTPRKNLSVIRVHDEVEKNSSSNIILGKSLLYETKNICSSKGVTEEAKINNPRKIMTTSAVKGKEANDNSMGNNLFEESRKNIATAKLSTEAINSAPSRRPADPANDKKSSKKLRTSVAQATGTSHNTSGMKLSTSVGPAVERSTGTAFLEAAKEYKEFEEKVKRTIYLDNLSFLSTDAVIKMALNQFGNVREVHFLTNYTVPFDIPQSAFVEMETEKDAEHVVNMLDEFPFMMSGMPRPVRAKRATAEMFHDHPRKPVKKLEFCWMSPTDPDYHNVRKFKIMSKRHEVENLSLIKNQLQEELLLAKQQQDNLNCNYRKLESIDSAILTGYVNRLTRIYNLNFDGVY